MSDADLSGLIAQEHLALKAACTNQCRLFHARRLVELRHQRGDYSAVIQQLDVDTKEAMARAILRDLKESKGE